MAEMSLSMADLSSQLVMGCEAISNILLAVPGFDTAAIAVLAFAFGPLAVTVGIGFWHLRPRSTPEPATAVSAKPPASEPGGPMGGPIPLHYRQKAQDEYPNKVPFTLLSIMALVPSVASLLVALSALDVRIETGTWPERARDFSGPLPTLAGLATLLLLAVHFAMPILAVMSMDWPWRKPRHVGLLLLAFGAGSLLYVLLIKPSGFWAGALNP